jgi:hypothetical protein
LARDSGFGAHAAASSLHIIPAYLPARKICSDHNLTPYQSMYIGICIIIVPGSLSDSPLHAGVAGHGELRPTLLPNDILNTLHLCAALRSN